MADPKAPGAAVDALSESGYVFRPREPPPRFIVGPVDVKPFSIELVVCEIRDDALLTKALHLAARVLDRETGLPIDITNKIAVPPEVLSTRASMNWGEWVRKQIGELLAHELAENILVDGHRVFDPHALPPLTMKVTL